MRSSVVGLRPEAPAQAFEHEKLRGDRGGNAENPRTVQVRHGFFLLTIYEVRGKKTPCL